MNTSLAPATSRAKPAGGPPFGAALRPQVLEEKELRGALEDLLRKMATGTIAVPSYIGRGAQDTSPVWGENLLRIGQEVLTNSLRHASASEFKARLSFERTRLSGAAR